MQRQAVPIRTPAGGTSGANTTEGSVRRSLLRI